MFCYLNCCFESASLHSYTATPVLSCCTPVRTVHVKTTTSHNGTTPGCRYQHTSSRRTQQKENCRVWEQGTIINWGSSGSWCARIIHARVPRASWRRLATATVQSKKHADLAEEWVTQQLCRKKKFDASRTRDTSRLKFEHTPHFQHTPILGTP